MDPSHNEVNEYLSSCDKETLIGLLLQAAETDVQFAELLRQRWLLAQGNPVDLSRYEEMIARACHTEEFVEYRHVPAFARHIELSLRPIDQMLQDGRFAEALKMIDYALQHVCLAFTNCHDDLEDVSTIIYRLCEQHISGCRLAGSDPKTVARVIFHREWNDEFGFFLELLPKYAVWLGTDGLEVYKSEMDSALAMTAKHPAHRHSDLRRSNLKRMAEIFSSVAEESD